MQMLRRLGFGLGAILGVLLQLNLAHAGIPPDHVETIEGTINYIHTSSNELVVNDMSYQINKDVVVKTFTGKTGRLSQLYPGKRIRMDVLLSGSGTKPAVIRTIYMLK